MAVPPKCFASVLGIEDDQSQNKLHSLGEDHSLDTAIGFQEHKLLVGEKLN